MQFKCVGRYMLKASMCTLFIILVAVLGCKTVYALDRVRSHLKVDEAQSAGYTGYGVRIGVFDEGHAYRNHLDFGWFEGAPLIRVSTPNVWDPSSEDEREVYNKWNHATMTVGTIIGDGEMSAWELGTANQWKGMAPWAEVQSYSFGVYDEDTNPSPVQHEDFIYDLVKASNTPSLNNGIHIANNSWGDHCNEYNGGAYTSLCNFLDGAVSPHRYDDIILRGPVIVFSAGNARNMEDCPNVKDKTPPFANYKTLTHPHAAKNIIVVGAVASYDNAMTAYSSWGPTDDGRIKPDLVASGQYGGEETNQEGISVLSGGYCLDYDRTVGIRAPIYDDPDPKDNNYERHVGTNLILDGNTDYLPYLHQGSIEWGQNLLKGHLLVNITDSSRCIIEKNSTWNAWCEGSLQGGDDNYWEDQDEYAIYRRYGCFGETSAAAAATSGSIALLLEAFHDDNIYDYLSSTIKALLIHTSTDLDDETSWYNKGPDYASGYGLVNIDAAIDHKTNPPEFSGIIEREIGMWGHQMHYKFRAYETTGELAFTLAWDDPPATENANPALSNDLNLTLRDPNGKIHYPWTLDPTEGNEQNEAKRDKPDYINNVEQVVIDHEDLVPGIWEAIVSTEELGKNKRQLFSLVGPGFTSIPNYEEAIELTANVPHSGWDTYYERNVEEYSNIPGYFQGPEVVHKITTSSQEDIRVELSDSNIHDVFIFNRYFNEILGSTYHNSPLAVKEDAPPGTYYIVVDSLDSTYPPDRYEKYTLTVSLTDEDFDGIHDEIDTDPNSFSDDFKDKATNGTEATNGKITDRGDQILTITDVPDDPTSGVLIKADVAGGNQIATVEVCNGLAAYKFYDLGAGQTKVTTTCGSVTTTVTKGSIEITFFGDNGRIATTTLSEGNTLLFDETTFTLTAPSTNTDSVTVITDDKEVTISPGDSITVFEQANVDIDPNSLNLKSKGNWITCYIELPEGYYVDDIDYETVLLENMLPVDQYSIEDNVFIGKFSRNDLIELIKSYGLSLPAEETLEVVFQNNAGTIFEGDDPILVQ